MTISTDVSGADVCHSRPARSEARVTCLRRRDPAPDSCQKRKADGPQAGFDRRAPHYSPSIVEVERNEPARRPTPSAEPQRVAPFGRGRTRARQTRRSEVPAIAQPLWPVMARRSSGTLLLLPSSGARVFPRSKRSDWHSARQQGGRERPSPRRDIHTDTQSSVVKLAPRGFYPVL